MTGPPFNQLLSSRYADAILKLLGEEIRVDSVTPELACQLVLENDRPEWSWLKNEYLYARGMQQAATAGQITGFQIRNPDQSLLCVVEDIVISSATAIEFTVGLVQTTADLVSAQTTGVPRDSRNDTNTPNIFAASRSILSRAPGPIAAGNVTEQVTLPANTPYHISALPAIISFSNALRIVTITVNVTVDVMIKFRERGFIPTEAT